MKDIEEQKDPFYKRSWVMSSLAAFLIVAAKVVSTFRQELLGIPRGYAGLNIILLFVNFIVLVISFVALLEIFMNWKLLSHKRKLIIPICFSTAAFALSAYTVIKFFLAF